MNDSTRRSIRAAIQLVLGTLSSLAAVLVIPGLRDQLDTLGLGGAFSWFALGVIALTTFFTKLQNTLEDAGTIPALLKAPASDGANPVPDDAEAGQEDHEPEIIGEGDPDAIPVEHYDADPSTKGVEVNQISVDQPTQGDSQDPEAKNLYDSI